MLLTYCADIVERTEVKLNTGVSCPIKVMVIRINTVILIADNSQHKLFRLSLSAFCRMTLGNLALLATPLAIMFTLTSVLFYRAINSQARTLQDELDAERTRELTREKSQRDYHDLAQYRRIRDLNTRYGEIERKKEAFQVNFVQVCVEEE